MNPEAKKRYKDIDLPFICPVTNRSFDSVKGLAIYLSKSLKFNHQEYYGWKLIGINQKSVRVRTSLCTLTVCS